MPFGWMHTWMQPGKYESPSTEQTQENAHSMQTTSVTTCKPFISNHVVYLHVFSFFLFYLKMPWCHTKLSNKETDTKMNNCSNNLHGGHMQIIRVTKSLYIKVCDSQFDYLWQNICDSNNTEILPSVASLVTKIRLGRNKTKQNNKK